MTYSTSEAPHIVGEIWSYSTDLRNEHARRYYLILEQEHKYDERHKKYNNYYTMMDLGDGAIIRDYTMMNAAYIGDGFPNWRREA